MWVKNTELYINKEGGGYFLNEIEKNICRIFGFLIVIIQTKFERLTQS